MLAAYWFVDTGTESIFVFLNADLTIIKTIDLPCPSTYLSIPVVFADICCRNICPCVVDVITAGVDIAAVPITNIPIFPDN